MMLRAVLMDFDGPICDVFAKLHAEEVAGRLAFYAAELLGVDRPSLYSSDPLVVRRNSWISVLDETVQSQIEQYLCDLEVVAALEAPPTPGADQLLRWLDHEGIPWAVVTNNCEEAVRAHFKARGLVAPPIVARDKHTPLLMKPAPDCLLAAVELLGGDIRTSWMLGDSVRDVQAAIRAGTPSIGLANKPGKEFRLRTAGATHVVTSMYMARDLIIRLANCGKSADGGELRTI